MDALGWGLEIAVARCNIHIEGVLSREGRDGS